MSVYYRYLLFKCQVIDFPVLFAFGVKAVAGMVLLQRGWWKFTKMLFILKYGYGFLMAV